MPPSPATVQKAPPRGGLQEFQQRRKQDSRECLLAAAAAAFCAHGYFAVSIEDIASAAGVSRMTFYRHFPGKADIAAALFRATTALHQPLLLAIGTRDFRNRESVAAWIAEIFACDRPRRQLLQVYIQANASDPAFTAQAHDFLRTLISELGKAIPAFALDPDDPAHRRRWIEAWLLVYEILDQSNHAARDAGVATDPLTIEILADRFLAFVAG